MNKIRKFQLFGERCSGTNYIQSLLQKNLPSGIQQTIEYGYKHWYLKDVHPRGKSNTTTDLECLSSIVKGQHDDVLFIIVVRNPYDWLRSMHANPHSAPDHKNITFSNFIRKEWHSYEHNKKNDLWKLSLRQQIKNLCTLYYAKVNGLWREKVSISTYYFIEKDDNICNLRSNKYRHWLSLRSLVQNFSILNYESVRDDCEFTLSKLIFEPFDIPVPVGGIIPEYIRQKGQKTIFSTPSYPSIVTSDKKWIDSQLDWSIESQLGYIVQESV